MLLQFKTNHKSVTKFNSIELPPFTILTGVNGSGKSHLLTAIEQRDVVIDGMENATIVRFDYETFQLDNEGTYSAQSISAETEAAWKYFQDTHKGYITAIKNDDIGAKYGDLLATCQNENKSLWDITNSAHFKAYKDRVKKHFNGPETKNNVYAQAIFSLLKRLPYSIDEISHDEFIKLFKSFAYKNDFLPTQLGRIVWEYYIKSHENEYKIFDNERHGVNNEVLKDKEFSSTYGEKPWEIINEILEKFDSLDYKINSPEGHNHFGNFQLKLVHSKKEDLEVDFSSLSSGEKILMALVASIYKNSSDLHFPDILLLDEIDASLHPSMIKNLLNVINEVFLDRGVKVILVTHAPTTIALAPEESIFVMNRSGLNRIEKKSRQEALEVLTEGFATLDQGIKLFDEISKQNISIITEGYNTKLIEKACEFYNYSDIGIIVGAESKSGDRQLKTLFQFFERVPHDKKVIFVWDCDVKGSLSARNNTYPYVLEKNTSNSIATKGIENMFHEDLFENFKTIIKPSSGEETVVFDKSRKRDFEAFILDRNNKDDFINFKPLFDYIDKIKGH